MDAQSFSEDRDQAMSLRILALLASTSFSLVTQSHGPEGHFQSGSQVQDERELGKPLRCQPHDRTRSPRSPLSRSSLQREPPSGSSRTWIGDRVERPWQLGGMRTMPATPELHTGTWKPRHVPKSWCSPFGCGDCHQGSGTEQCGVLQRSQGQAHRPGMCRGVRIGQSGEDSTAESGTVEGLQDGQGGSHEFEGSSPQFDSSSGGTGIRGRDERHSGSQDKKAGPATGRSGVQHQDRRILEPNWNRGSSEPSAIPMKSTGDEVQNDFLANFSKDTWDDAKGMDIEYDIVQEYNLYQDGEEQWMDDACFEQVQPREQEMIEIAVNFHQNEIEECFKVTSTPDVNDALDLMELCCESDSLLSACMERWAASPFELDFTTAST